MLKFFTSLSFLYIFVILLMIVYGALYYKSFVKNGYQRRSFPWVFLLIAMGCFSFLWFNIHAPLQLKTFSNLDHHFIRHDGFKVARQIVLGRTDTVNNKGVPFNQFLLKKDKDQLTISSGYSEDPFYTADGEKYRLASVSYPAMGHRLSFNCDSAGIVIRGQDNGGLELLINNRFAGKVVRDIRRGVLAWDIFKDDTAFINSGWYAREKIVNSLRSIILLRNNFSEREAGELSFFISGRFFQYAGSLQFDARPLSSEDLSYSAAIADRSLVGWGIGFPEKNKNQFRVDFLQADSFTLAYRYPISYPFTEEPRKGEDGVWTPHSVNKFLVSDPLHIRYLPSVFEEGFLFAAFPGDSSIDFDPVLLSYQKAASDKELQIGMRSLRGTPVHATATNSKLQLPSRSADFSWNFSIVNSFDWKLGGRLFSPQTWQLYLFGSLFFFFIMVFGSSWLKPANKLSWIWQLLACVALVMLTTRFFLYWRYKTFPPYEGLDLPSLQQLNSFWNFGIIVFTTLLLALVFGFDLLRFGYHKLRTVFRNLSKTTFKESSYGKVKGSAVGNRLSRFPFLRKFNARTLFFASWILLLLGAGAIVVLTNFNTAVSRHLAIVLICFYFIYLYISCRYSPLVIAAEKSWWKINTNSISDLIISNPVKVLLSISLLGLFSFIDIGFALIFFNFLLFNEAFLFINYSIAGLAAGSRRNASIFGLTGMLYLFLFAANLVVGPYLFKYFLELSSLFYTVGYLLFALLIAYSVGRLLVFPVRKKILVKTATAICLFALAFLFFPKERIQQKAAITKYRIDVLTTPTDKVVEKAYRNGDSYEPVIRAAQNQWFINSFIYEENNPSVNKAGFHLLPHAPQNRGAKYNAQATDLIASRFLIAEHGRWSILLFALVLFLPMVLLAYFYKLYPDFTNRINDHYPTISIGFSLLNYLLITALLVILAATGRYIFFGQDLPFGSILSKQSILFPSAILIAVIFLFRNVSLQRYPNKAKLFPGAVVFAGLVGLLFFVKPVFNKDKKFGVAELATNMDGYIRVNLQPIFDEIDTAVATRNLTLAQKDQLFTAKLNEMREAGLLEDAGEFLQKQIEQYCRAGFFKHLDQNRMLFLDLNSGKPRLASNDNFFYVEPPPHLAQSWSGNVFSDSSAYNICWWEEGKMLEKRLTGYTAERTTTLSGSLQFSFRKKTGDDLYEELSLVNKSGSSLALQTSEGKLWLANNDTLSLRNPDRILFTDPISKKENILLIQPDAFMKNYYVNGSRFYLYPMGSNFIWARSFAESISAEYATTELSAKNVFLSLNAALTDTLSARIGQMLRTDTAYKKGAEYAICIADGNGRLWTMPDHIKELYRPDPNDKAGFNKVVLGNSGYFSQSELRKRIGNINLLRMNPGPGSTLKPIIFSAIASQLSLDWDQFAAEGFSQKQQFFGGEKVAEYDFEKNNGRIATVSDYLKYSDNYYHSNLLLLGSYSKQGLAAMLSKYFTNKNPSADLHWPYFSYKGQQYWLNGFENWPGYIAGKANFGSDSSFVSIGLFGNYGIHTYRNGRAVDRFTSSYDSILFKEAWNRSGFILPEYALFDQKGTGMNLNRPNEVFLSSFRGHVKGSSQVMIPPVKMLDATGKLVSQNKNYSLTLDPYAGEKTFSPFDMDNGVRHSHYLSLMKESVFIGMKEVLFGGTASRLGNMLKNALPYFYYAKTGTTGDDELKTKSKLLTLVISKKDIADPGFNFRKNKFIIIYFTSQNGPVKQNEEFQAEVIRLVEQSAVFRQYMASGN